MQTVAGFLEVLPQGGGFLRQSEFDFHPSQEDAWVSIQLMREYGLPVGAEVTGTKELGPRGFKLVKVEQINGLDPEAFKSRIRFEKLQAVNPAERIPLGCTGDLSMRIIDAVAPIGLGTRALIVAPPRTGKTMLLESMTHSITRALPGARVMVLLIDERPEEVTQFRRSVNAQVLASSLDEGVDAHVQLVDMAMGQMRCDLECGRNVVVLVDSLTRMARAFNQSGPGSRKTLSGGIDARALEIPRRFFGMARNVEHGGSVTVLATALIETGSRMDEYVYQEFKGTGNCEIVLDQNLADHRIFPALNIQASGTRRQELLYTEEELKEANQLRRKLMDMDEKTAIQTLLGLAAASTATVLFPETV